MILRSLIILGLVLDICILDENKRELEYMTILNKENSIIDFLTYLNSEYPRAKYYFGYEATNNYMRVLYQSTNHSLQLNLEFQLSIIQL